MSENAFCDLYQTFRLPLLRFIRRKTGDAHLAEDLLHDVFIKAESSLDQLRDNQKLQSWLYAIAANTINDHFRKNKPAQPLLHEIPTPTDEDESFIRELECCLEGFIRSLPPQQASALRSAYLEEMTLPEIAQRDCINLSTLKSHIKRGKQRLKELFGECCTFQTGRDGTIVDFTPKPR